MTATEWHGIIDDVGWVVVAIIFAWHACATARRWFGGYPDRDENA